MQQQHFAQQDTAAVPCRGAIAGKLCIEVTSGSKLAWISEELCIGCGICVKVRGSSSSRSSSSSSSSSSRRLERLGDGA
jgi:NAD-dependent dihydropyrimidine dehydrogenase PreA subunit